ncbi:MAG: DUF262 domain-containing protein [Nitrospirae bacterium]|nr:DUF262 domain-containing protein [Nitrospirota bacterium]
MQISRSEHTISEIVEGFDKDIKINRDYQRSDGIWPDTARVYFIDTILEGYPFPKLYFHQIYDKSKKKPMWEIVDGQQRIHTIIDFLNNELRLSKASQKYSGCYFKDLPDETQDAFRTVIIQVDKILSAEKYEILEMFRRMNAYTAPLNPAEQRHAKYQGKFKWFAAQLADKIGVVIEQFGILSSKQIMRMADVEFIADLAIVLDEGIVSKSSKSTDDIYKKYEKDFENEDRYRDIITSFFDTLALNFSELRNTYLMKTYAVHSFFCAFAYIKYGIPDGENAVGFSSPMGDIKYDKKTIEQMLALSYAHEIKDLKGEFREYVDAATSTTTKAAQRRTRTRTIAQIIR